MPNIENVSSPNSNARDKSKKDRPPSKRQQAQLSFKRFVSRAWVPSTEARIRTKGEFLPFRYGATADAVGWQPIEVADTLAFLKHYSWLAPDTDKYGFAWLVEQIKSLIQDDEIRGTVMMGMLRVPTIFESWRTAEKTLH